MELAHGDAFHGADEDFWGGLPEQEDVQGEADSRLKSAPFEMSGPQDKRARGIGETARSEAWGAARFEEFGVGLRIGLAKSPPQRAAKNIAGFAVGEALRLQRLEFETHAPQKKLAVSRVILVGHSLIVLRYSISRFWKRAAWLRNATAALCRLYTSFEARPAMQSIASNQQKEVV
jgi:hypothetical protein